MNTKLIISKAKEEKRGLFETEAMTILESCGISVPDFEFAKSQEEAVAKAVKVGYPVVMKIVSRDILHKTDYGCVKLNLKNNEEVEKAYFEIMCNAKEKVKDVRIEGVVIYPFVSKGTEVIIGVTYDEQFGSAIMFGLGGIFVEVLKDVAFRIIPLSEEDARSMIKETKGYSLLKGLRGQTPKDIDSIVDVILKISKLVTYYPEIREMDLNPVYVYDNGLTVVDARIIVA